jgi:hypothetical protein
MFKNKAVLLLASALLAMPGVIQAQGVTPTAGSKGGAVSADGLVKRYQTLAGSEANAKSLVNGLRTGADVSLVGVGQDTIVYETRIKYKEVPVYEQIPVYEKTFVPCPPPALPGRMCEVQKLVGYKDGALIRTDRVEDGTEQVAVTKPGGVTTLTFSPGAAAPMGFGNVDIALALTEARLRPNATPSPAELKAALGEILGKRAGGEGWGEIAKSYGFDLK